MRPPLLPPVGSHQTNPFKQQDVKPSPEWKWTPFIKPENFHTATKGLGAPTVPGEISCRPHMWVSLHCICGRTVYLEVADTEDGRPCFTCGRRYRFRPLIEIKEQPDVA